MRTLSSLFSRAEKEVDPFTLSAVGYRARFMSTGAPHQLVDVRSPAEFAESHLASAQNIPLPDLANRLKLIPQDQPVMLYCRSGNRSGIALQMLRAAGFENAYNIGGLSDLAKQGVPVSA